MLTYDLIDKIAEAAAAGAMTALLAALGMVARYIPATMRAWFDARAAVTLERTVRNAVLYMAGLAKQRVDNLTQEELLAKGIDYVVAGAPGALKRFFKTDQREALDHVARKIIARQEDIARQEIGLPPSAAS